VTTRVVGSRAIFRRFAYLAAFWLLLTGVALGPQDASAANGRYALIIGNSNYSFAPLRNPANDASLMAATLRVLGFEVFEYKDINQREMKRAIVDFGRALERAGRDSVGLFYYAGHGVQVGGENYLIPVGSTIRDELDVDIEGVRASIVLAALERAGNALNMVILDACRNNPFQSGSRAARSGLARMDAPSGTLVAYSTAPGRVAEDGRGRNSPYTQALARAMQAPGEKVEEVFKTVRISVMERTNQRQVPWEASSLTGDFYFVNPAVADQTQSLPGKIPAVPAQSNQAVEIEYWKSIANSDNPDLYRSYLSAFPNGLFATIAEERLRSNAAQATPSPQNDLEEQRALWESIQNNNDPSLLQAFLNRFPSGLYAPLATARLDTLQRQQAAPQEDPLMKDLRLWNAIKDSNRPSDYMTYLGQFPNGQFAALAQARLSTLNAQQQPSQQVAQAPVVKPVAVPKVAPAQIAAAPAVRGPAVWRGRTVAGDPGSQPLPLCFPGSSHEITLQVDGDHVTGTITAEAFDSLTIDARKRPNGRFNGKLYYDRAWVVHGTVTDDKITGKFYNPHNHESCRGEFTLTR